MPDHSISDAAGSLLWQRYREAAPAGMAWSEAIGLMVGHRSVRAYTSQALPAGTIEALVAAAQSAASSSNLQTWSVVAVEDAGVRGRLSEVAGGQKHIRQAPLLLVWLADLSRNEQVAGRAGRTLEGLPFLESFLVASIDAALAAQNATVAAESLGLGTVYIGALRNGPEAVAAELGLPPGCFAVFGLCVGYEDKEAPAAIKPRLPQRVVLHRERYAAAAPGDVAGYDEALRGFQKEQAMPSQGWTELVLNRLGAIKALSGRDRLGAALRALGFGLK